MRVDVKYTLREDRAGGHSGIQALYRDYIGRYNDKYDRGRVTCQHAEHDC